MTRRKAFMTLLGGTVVALAVGEIATRVLVPDPYLVFENRFEMFARDDYVGYRNQPNYRGYAQGTIRVRTNSLGFRGPDVSVEKPPGTVRLVMLGDSVTWGIGVQEEATFPRLIERTLNDGHTGGLRFEAVNMSVIGYSLHQELRALDRYGIGLSPDVVVIAFAMNDAYPTEDPFFNVHPFHQPVRDGVQRREYASTPPPTSYLYRWVRSVFRHARRYPWRQAGPPRLAAYDEWPAGSFESRAWPAMQKHFLSLKDLADRYDFRLVVAVLPTAAQLGPSAPSSLPQSQLREFFEQAGLDYLDLTETLRGHVAAAFRDNMHLTKAGHRSVADAIVADLTKRGWLVEVRRIASQ